MSLTNYIGNEVAEYLKSKRYPPAQPGSNEILDMAVWLIEQGIRVVPNWPRVKKTIFKRFGDDAIDAAEIAVLWWTCRPYDNVGILLGERSKIVIAEYDSPEEHEAILKAFGGAIPVTWTSQGSSRGHALWFRWREGLPPVGVFTALGFEFRIGNGGADYQHIAPGSIHPRGVRYQWVDGRSPQECELAELPEVFVANVREGWSKNPHQEQHDQEQHDDGQDEEKEEDRLDYGCDQEPDEIVLPDAWQNVDEGYRWDASKKVIGKLLHDFDVEDPAAIYGAWTMADNWNKGNNPPWPRGALFSLFHNTTRKERARQRSAKGAAPEPFPVDAFPGPIAQFIEEALPAFQAPPEMFAIPMLVGLASAISNTRQIEIKSDWVEPSVLWGAVIVPAGGMKTQTGQAVLSPLYEEDRRLGAEYRDAVKQWRKDKRVWDAMVKKDPTLEEPSEPLNYRRIIKEDNTIEGVLKLLKDNPSHTPMCHCSELSGWIGSFDRYRSGGGKADCGTWLSLYDAGEYRSDRAAEGRSISLSRAGVSMTGAIQDDLAQKLFRSDHLSDGLIPRMMLAMPQCGPITITKDVISEQAKTKLRQIYDRLFALQMRGEREEPGRPENWKPHTLTLTEEAQDRLIGYANELEQQKAVVYGSGLKSAFSKLRGMCARNALVVHMVRCVTGEIPAGDAHLVIDMDSVNRAIRITEWLKGSAIRVYQTFLGSKKLSAQDWLIDAIKKSGGKISAKELRDRNQSRYPTSEDAEKALQGLEEEGLGKLQDRPIGPKGGRGTKDFVLFKM